MMKHMKKVFALVLVLMLVLSLATTAFAEKNDSITVTGVKKGETYKIYKMFALSVNSEEAPTAYSYTVTEEWKAFFTGTGAGAEYITINDRGYVETIAEEDAADLAEAAALYAKTLTAKKTIKCESDTVVFEGLENGYWLITSTLGTKAMIKTTPDANAVKIDEKNPVDTIEKEVKEDSGAWGDSNDAQIGDTVEFKATVTLVPGTRNVVVHDKMDAGLTFVSDSIEINGLTAGAEYTVDEDPTDDDTFDITFADTYIDSLKATVTLTITYEAVLNENAVVKGDEGVQIKDQHNMTNITFGDSQTSTTEQTTTTTHKFSVFKHAADSEENLAGAVFSLKKAGTVVKLIKLDDNNYRVANGEETGAVTSFTTVASGDIVIWGVDADSDYTLEEITAPEGYNKLTAAKSVTVDAADTTRIDVVNNAGAKLPETGGMGTTLFYIIGGLLVVGAVVLLITKKRMASAE